MTNAADIQSLLKQAGKDLPAIDQIANYLLQRRLPLEPVLQAYKKFLAYKPDSANAAFNHAYYLSRDGQFEAAIEQYRHALRLGIDAPEEVHLNIANIFIDHLKNAEKARKCLQKALSIKPDYASAYYNLGNLSEQEGDRLEAQRCFELCLKFDPSNESALARLADAHIFRDADDPLVGRLAGSAQRSKNSDVFFALGRAYEQLSQFDLAWSNFTKANQLDRQTLPAYNQAATESVFRRIMSQCTEEWLKSFQGESDPSVFICGMFRSGSTLLEQVLAAHPGFVAGGESEFFPRLVTREFRHYPDGLVGLTSDRTRSWKAQHKEQSLKLYGDALRVTDKRPDNFLHIGLIKAVLPSARFLVTERDWRDVATSVFSTRLGAGQNYATSLADIRHYIRLQEKLVDHWQSLLGSDLLRVSYEDLVTESRATIGAVLNALGEAWDERCLSFSQLRNTVQTASVWQVREPMHTKSVGRWRHYRQYFDNAFGAEFVSSKS
jgi:tetratricopeptide (TPR) repeat protein